MKYQCCPHDPEQFATNLRRDSYTRNLTWDSAKGQGVLIVQVRFGEEENLTTEELCEILNTTGYLLHDEFEDLPGGISVCFVSAVDKARNSGCRMNGEACSYMVFSILPAGAVCKVFCPPDNQTMIKSYVRIPLQISVQIQEETVLRGMFKKKEEKTGFFILSFPVDLAAVYMDGSLTYRVGDLEIPITKEMIKMGTVFVLSPEWPQLSVKNPGLSLN